MKSDWESCLLGDLIEINQNNISKNYPFENIRYVDISSVGSGTISFENVIELSDAPSRAKRLAMNGDTIISTVRPGNRSFAYLKKCPLNSVYSTGFAVLHPLQDRINPRFLYYTVSDYSFTGYLTSVEKGASYPSVDTNDIKSARISIPNIKIQNKIASILSAYDDLIENNLKRIKLLEEKAQLTYEEWFVRMKYPGHENDVVDSETGLPEGWTKYMLSEAADFLNGYAFKPRDLGEKGYPVIKIKEMKNGVVSDTPRNSGDLINEKYLVTKGDILFSWSATLEVIIWKEETGLLNQHLFKVTPKEPFKRSYVYLACKNALKQFELLTTGATMKHIKRKELDFVTANFPGTRLMSSFEKEVEPLLETMVRLKQSIGQLNMAKGVLLPRLMSGMIDIDEIKYNYPKETLA